MTSRTPLPSRRRCETHAIDWRGAPLTVCIGFDDGGAPREVFVDGPREGSDIQHQLADACVVISIALQHDVPPALLLKSLGAVPDWSSGEQRPAPASVIGAVLRVVAAASLPAIGARG
jgi:hypothetical protein